MEIETSGAVQLFFPSPSLSLVYFEAIANSLDAGATKISVELDLFSFDKPDTLKVTIRDNGDGFNDDNFERFKTLLKPRDEFHKGIGRLVYLHYFGQVQVVSRWSGFERHFVFKEDFNDKAASYPTTKLNDETTLVFSGFLGNKIKSYDDVRPQVLKERIIEHFLPTLSQFVDSGRDFCIDILSRVSEGNNKKGFSSESVKITASDLPLLEVHSINFVELDFFQTIDMRYHVKYTGGKCYNLIAVCVDGRTIPVNLFPSSKIPVGYSVIFLFSSELFNMRADSSRQNFNLSEDLSKSKLYERFKREIAQILIDKIPQISMVNSQINDQFERQFPHLLGYFDDTVIGFLDKDAALDAAQSKFFKSQKEILQAEHLDERTYEKSLELSARTLTEYVLYREKIISKMKEMHAENSEADIHNLIVPKHTKHSQSDTVKCLYQNNAWLLDDKFMTFRTILSEARMSEVIKAVTLEDDKSEDDGRPDISMIFSADPNDNTPVDVVIVEIKKKTDVEKDNLYAITQLLQRAEKLVEFCPNIQRMWYYAVIQINKNLANRLRQLKWTPLYSKGDVFYQEYDSARPDGTIVPTPTTVMSFDAIISDAQSRNHTFLEILRSSMKAVASDS